MNNLSLHKIEVRLGHFLPYTSYSVKVLYEVIKQEWVYFPNVFFDIFPPH